MLRQLIFYTDRVAWRSGEDNVFTVACHYFHGGVSFRGVSAQGVPMQTTPYCHVAVGTHPTGMHSCKLERPEQKLWHTEHSYCSVHAHYLTFIDVDFIHTSTCKRCEQECNIEDVSCRGCQCPGSILKIRIVSRPVFWNL